jgi:nitrilase
MIHKKVKVGVVQATPALFDLEKTVEIIVAWIERGASEGCEMLLFPESFIPCYPRGLDFGAIIGKRTEKGRNQWLELLGKQP